MPMPKNAEEAADLFLRRLVARAYDGVIKDETELLTEGWQSRHPPEKWASMHRRFRELAPEDQELVEEIIRDTAHSSVFGSLVLLDNALTGFAIEDKTYEFALFFRAWTTGRESKDLPDVSIQISPLVTDYDLHDMFKFLLQERDEKQSTGAQSDT